LVVLEEELYKHIKDEGSRPQSQGLAANKATSKSHGPQSFQLALSTNHLGGHFGAAGKG